MTTARILVTGALDLIGIHAAEEPLTAHQEQQGLAALNRLVQSASLEHFLVYYTPAQHIPWPPGTFYQTWGIGGEIAMARPVQISQEAYRHDGTTVLPIEVLTPVAFRQQTVGVQPRFGLPQCVTYDPALPFGFLSVWPIPSEPTTLTVYPWTVLRIWPEFDDDILMPPGYERWLMAACACDLAPFYDREPSGIVQGIRMEARDNIKTANTTIPTLDVPWFADPYTQWGNRDAIRSWP